MVVEVAGCPTCGHLDARGDAPSWRTFAALGDDLYACPTCAAQLQHVAQPPSLTRLTAPRETALMWVWRCPTCGATDAGPDESRSVVDLTYMACRACGFGELADSWARDADWSLEVRLVVGLRKLPAYVAPLAPGTGFYETLGTGPKIPAAPSAPTAAAAPIAPPAVAAPSASTSGCAECRGADAARAYTAARAVRDGPLVVDVHFAVYRTRCACGQAFIHVWCERVAWGGGEDDQTTLAVAVSADEAERLAGLRPAQVGGALTAAVQGRPFLVVSGGNVWWRAEGFAIGPHD